MRKIDQNNLYQPNGVRYTARRRRLGGQSLIEYVILLVFITGLSGLIFRSFNRIMGEGFQTMAAEVEKSLTTGSFDFKGENIHQTGWIK